MVLRIDAVVVVWFTTHQLNVVVVVRWWKKVQVLKCVVTIYITQKQNSVVLIEGIDYKFFQRNLEWMKNMFAVMKICITVVMEYVAAMTGLPVLGCGVVGTIILVSITHY